MNLKEFFNSNIAALPRSGFNDSKETFDEFLGQQFRRYIEEAKLLNDSMFGGICSEIRSAMVELEELSASIARAVKLYLGGNPSSAYYEAATSLARLDLTPFHSELTESKACFDQRDPFSLYHMQCSTRNFIGLGPTGVISRL